MGSSDSVRASDSDSRNASMIVLIANRLHPLKAVHECVSSTNMLSIRNSFNCVEDRRSSYSNMSW